MLEVSAVASLAVGLLTTLIRILREDPRFQGFWGRLENNKVLIESLRVLGIQLPKKRESYEVRMQRLFSKFQEVSAESQDVVAEIERNVREKESVVNRLDQQYKELDQRLEKLRQSPEYGNAQTLRLLEQMSQEQKRDSRGSALRDYSLFFLGVASPYVLNWIFSQFGGPKVTP